jgi:hypothetical protein
MNPTAIAVFVKNMYAGRVVDVIEQRMPLMCMGH